MHHIELSPDEYGVLHELLAARLADIRREIHHTDSREFRTLLLEQEDVLVRLLARMEAQAVTA